MDLTDAIKEAYEYAPANVTYYDTLKITHALLVPDPILIVRDYKKTVRNMGTFLPVMFDFSLPETSGAVRGEMTISVTGLPKLARKTLQNLALLSVVDPIQIYYQQYINDEMEPDAELPLPMSETSIRETYTGVEITAMLPDLVNAFMPRKLMTWTALYEGGDLVPDEPLIDSSFTWDSSVHVEDSSSSGGGEPSGWSGNFITVGPSGKDYTNLTAGYAAAVDGDIILCYGTTAATSLIAPNKRVFIRGMGATPNDTWITGNFNSQLLRADNGSNVLVENMTFRQQFEWRHSLSISDGGILLANKCHLTSYDNEVYPVGGNSVTNISLTLTLRNCKISKGYSHLMALYLPGVFLDKVELNAAYFAYICSGTLGQNDYVETPTANYGYGYGTLVISDAFLASHGY